MLAHVLPCGSLESLYLLAVLSGRRPLGRWEARIPAASCRYTSAMKDSPVHPQQAATPSADSPPMNIQRVVLTGFMGAGKSTVGKLLAPLTGWDFLDLDTHIEETSGATAQDLFAALGEAGFRRLESETFAAALRRSNVILAPGGAVIDRIENQQALAGSKHTLVVYLHAPFQTLIERCLQQERMGNATYRPLLHQTETANLRYQARKLLYSEHAQLIVDVAEKSPQEIAGTILEHMHAVSCTLQQ
jgi:shikimate kinase